LRLFQWSSMTAHACGGIWPEKNWTSRPCSSTGKAPAHCAPPCN